MVLEDVSDSEIQHRLQKKERKMSMMKTCATICMVFVFCLAFSMSGVALDIAPEANFTDYDEYLEYISSGDLPEGFVHFEDVSLLGSFYQYVSYRDAFLYYSFHGHTFCSTPENYYSYDVELSPPKSSDLRYCDVPKGYAYRMVGKCVYVYLSGKIDSIKWSTAERDFCIRFDYLSSPYGDSFVSRLLNFEKAVDAQEQLFASMKIEPLIPEIKPTDKTPITDTESNIESDPIDSSTKEFVSGVENASFPWLWLALPVGAVVIVGGAAFFLLRKKRRD